MGNMIKYSKLPENIAVLIPPAISYLQSSPNVRFAYLFGSHAKGTSGPLSDIDIAVYLKKGADLLKSKLELLGKLMDLLRTEEIDLVILNSASLPLRMRILENREVIVDKDPFLRHKYESITMRMYFDFSFIEKAILERRFLGGR